MNSYMISNGKDLKLTTAASVSVVSLDIAKGNITIQITITEFRKILIEVK